MLGLKLIHASKKSPCNQSSHLSVILLHSQPAVYQEVEFLIPLEVCHDDVLEVPGGVLATSAIIMEDTHEVQLS